jgi:hypothetical protein
MERGAGCCSYFQTFYLGYKVKVKIPWVGIVPAAPRIHNLVNSRYFCPLQPEAAFHPRSPAFLHKLSKDARKREMQINERFSFIFYLLMV